MRRLLEALMPSCREVTSLLAADELASASWARRAAVRLHLSMCEHCSRLARQLRVIAQGLRAAWAPRPREDAAALKRRVLERLRRA